MFVKEKEDDDDIKLIDFCIQTFDKRTRVCVLRTNLQLSLLRQHFCVSNFFFHVCTVHSEQAESSKQFIKPAHISPKAHIPTMIATYTSLSAHF